MAATVYAELLPKVAGRHRDADLAARRRNKAAAMVLGGWTYEKVAEHLGYANRGTVHRLVRRALSDTTSVGVGEALDLHMERLEGILSTWYPLALEGDARAVRVVLEVLRQEAKFCGLLDGPAVTAADQVGAIDPADLVKAARARAEVAADRS